MKLCLFCLWCQWYSLARQYWLWNAEAFPKAGLQLLVVVCIWAFHHLQWRFFLSVKNQATWFFLHVFFRSSFSDARSINVSKMKRSQLWQFLSSVLCMPVLLFFLQVQHCLSGSTLDSPCPQQVIHISTSVFSVKSFCILCRAQEGCGLLFTFKWGKLAFAWFLQHNAYFTFKREKQRENKTQQVRWVTCFILVQAPLGLLLRTAFHRTEFQDGVQKFSHVKRPNNLYK